MVVGRTMGLVLVVSAVVGSAFVVGSALYYLFFDRVVDDVGSERARRVLRDGVALGGALVGVGVFGAAVNATATVAGLASGGPPPGPLERTLRSLPTGWLPWLLAAGLLLVVGSAVVACAEQLRTGTLD